MFYYAREAVPVSINYLLGFTNEIMLYLMSATTRIDRIIITCASVILVFLYTGLFFYSMDNLFFLSGLINFAVPLPRATTSEETSTSTSERFDNVHDEEINNEETSFDAHTQVMKLLDKLNVEVSS